MSSLGLGNLFNGLGSLGRMGASLADSEVSSSVPVLGVFQYLMSGPGLEAVGGVTLASIVGGLVSKLLFGKLLGLGQNVPSPAGAAPAAQPPSPSSGATAPSPTPAAPATPTTPAASSGTQGLGDDGTGGSSMKGALVRVGSGLTSAVLMWELGRLTGSGNIGKFGAFYSLGRLIEEELVRPYVFAKIPYLHTLGLSGYAYGLGQARVPDTQELRDLSYLAQNRVPDTAEFNGLGQRIVTEEELLGDVGQEDQMASDEDSNLF